MANSFYFNNMDALEMATLKRCLGDSDGDTSVGSYEANEVYNWDFGTPTHPHLVKLVDSGFIIDDAASIPSGHSAVEIPTRSVVRLCNSTLTWNALTNMNGWCEDEKTAGFYLPLFYDILNDCPLGDKIVSTGGGGGCKYGPVGVGSPSSHNGRFTVIGTKGLNSFVKNNMNTVFNVFTTTGFLTNVQGFSNSLSAHGNWQTTAPAPNANLIYTKDWKLNDDSDVHWVGPATNDETLTIDCETAPLANNGAGTNANQCLEKGDQVMFFDFLHPNTASNQGPLFHNIYTVEKIFHDRDMDTATPLEPDSWTNQGSIKLNMRPNFNDAAYLAYKFEFPAQKGGFEYVAECSSRGLCNHDNGLCECFTGHTSDDCSVQNSLAK